MELYESLFIIRTSVSDEETAALIEKMKAVAEKTGAQFIKSENWGKKKLAYEVKRERKEEIIVARKAGRRLRGRTGVDLVTGVERPAGRAVLSGAGAEAVCWRAARRRAARSCLRLITRGIPSWLWTTFWWCY